MLFRAAFIQWIHVFVKQTFLNFPGAAEEATSVFGEVAALCIQKQHLNHGLAYQNSQASSDDRNYDSEDIGPRGMRHMNANNTRDVPGNYHGAVMT